MMSEDKKVLNDNFIDKFVFNDLMSGLSPDHSLPRRRRLRLLGE